MWTARWLVAACDKAPGGQTGYRSWGFDPERADRPELYATLRDLGAQGRSYSAEAAVLLASLPDDVKESWGVFHRQAIDLIRRVEESIPEAIWPAGLAPFSPPPAHLIKGAVDLVTRAGWGLAVKGVAVPLG